MSDTLFTVLAVGLGILLGGTLLCLLGLVVILLDAGRQRRRSRRRRVAQANGEGEPPDVLAAFGVDISVWPSRAPRNGQSHEEASA